MNKKNVIFFNKINFNINLFVFTVLISGIMVFNVSHINSFNESGSLKFFKQFLQLILNVGIYYLTIFFLKRKNVIISAVKILFFSALLISLFGLYEFLSFYMNLPYPRLFLFNPSFGGVTRAGIVTGGGVSYIIPRISSTLSEPLFLGNYLMTPIYLWFALAINRVNLFKLPILNWSIGSILVVTFFLTFSKGAYMGLLFAMIFLFIFSKLLNLKLSKKTKRILKIILIVMFIVCVTAIFISILKGMNYYNFIAIILGRIPYAFQTLSEDLKGGTYERIESIKTALRIFINYPIIGIGWGNTVFYFYKYSSFIVGKVWPGIHSLYFRILCELGILGIISFFCLLYSIIKRNILVIRYTDNDPILNSFALGALLALMASLIQQISEDLINLPYFWFLIGFISSLYNNVELKELTENK